MESHGFWSGGEQLLYRKKKQLVFYFLCMHADVVVSLRQVKAFKEEALNFQPPNDKLGRRTKSLPLSS